MAFPPPPVDPIYPQCISKWHPSFFLDRTIGGRRRTKKDAEKPLKQLRKRRKKTREKLALEFTNRKEKRKKKKKKQMTSSPMAIECNLASNCTLVLPVITFFFYFSLSSPSYSQRQSKTTKLTSRLWQQWTIGNSIRPFYLLLFLFTSSVSSYGQ